MVSSESGWHYAGAANITQEGKINIAKRVFDAGILDPTQVVYWAYERTVGYLVISDKPLVEKPRYKPQGNSNIGSKDQSYRTNIPKTFFSDYKGRGSSGVKQSVPNHAQVEYGERLFFVFRTEMAESDPSSCYLFDWQQFDNTIGYDEWADPLDDLPRFIS